MKSVRMRILVSVCLLVAVSLLLVGGGSIYLNSWTTRGVLEQTMTGTAKVAADRVSNQLRAYRIIAQDAGHDPILADPNISIAQKQTVIDEICARHADIVRGDVLDANGLSIFTGQDFSGEEYFKQSLQGNSWIAEPLVSKVTGAVTISAPLYNGGTITGVVYLVPAEEFLNDIARSIKLSENGSAVIIGKEGIVIGHPNADFVTKQHNSQELAKSNPSLKPVAELERDMVAGNIGFGTYTMSGVEKFMAYAPIADSGGWSIHVNSPIKDFMSYTNTSILISSMLLVLALIAAAVIAVNLAGSIGKPLKSLAGMLDGIVSTGKLELDAEAISMSGQYMAKKDEIGEIARAVDGLVEMLAIDSKELNVIAGGDLTIEIALRSPDDTLGNAMCKMSDNLNTMFANINGASAQVSTGSKQIADGAQALAQGSTQQSAAVEQLSASINEIAGMTKENVDMAVRAASLGNTIKSNAEKGSRQMDEMMRAVKEINEASQSISKVIKVIDDIAFQTNILALNAAVEAARAGQHGKGFAVVAEEVRSLAAKSAEAAKDTGSLISNSIEKAELGARISGETAASLAKIVEGINESSRIVTEIAKSSGEQEAAITQINVGIDQVAQVVQQNSATAEESAAASEEMSGQSAMLTELVAGFKIKQNAALRLSDGTQSSLLPKQLKDAWN